MNRSMQLDTETNIPNELNSSNKQSSSNYINSDIIEGNMNLFDFMDNG